MFVSVRVMLRPWQTGLDVRKPVFSVFRASSSGVCINKGSQKRRPACTSAQFDQPLYYSLCGKYRVYKQSITFLASLCS